MACANCASHFLCSNCAFLQARSQSLSSQAATMFQARFYSASLEHQLRLRKLCFDLCHLSLRLQCPFLRTSLFLPSLIRLRDHDWISTSRDFVGGEGLVHRRRRTSCNLLLRIISFLRIQRFIIVILHISRIPRRPRRSCNEIPVLNIPSSLSPFVFCDLIVVCRP